jgi:hypothetical protein
LWGVFVVQEREKKTMKTMKTMGKTMGTVLVVALFLF